MERVRFVPYPGTASEAAVLDPPENGKASANWWTECWWRMPWASWSREWRRFSWITSAATSMSATLGAVFAPDGLFRLRVGLVRLPDMTGVFWDRFPGAGLPADPVCGVSLDLAVEVVSRGNTDAEMEGKREGYLAAGAQAVWMWTPSGARAEIDRPGAEDVIIDQNGELEAEELLPGLCIGLGDLVRRARRRSQ